MDKPAAEVPWHAQSATDLLANIATGRDGLTAAEARLRLASVGPNELRRERQVSTLKLFLHQFREFLVLLLLAATAVSLALGEMLDAVVIFAIVLLSAFLGFLQEYRASRALSALRALAAPIADVVRDGEEQRIVASEIVPGDIVLLAEGDRAPADLRILEQYNLQVDESLLTGESEPVTKQEQAVPVEAALTERANVVFSGTTITHGRGVGVVVATGMRTEFGRIAHLVQTFDAAEQTTPLERRMAEIGRWLGISGLLAVVVVVALGLLRGRDVLEMFFWGVSLAVAVVPEALPAVVTGALTIGVQRMARRHAIVRRLPAVETLGATTVICSDKTGTLTMNQMTVRALLSGGRLLEVTGTGYEPAGLLLLDGQPIQPGEPEAALLRVAALCNDAHLVRGAAGQHSIVGDPTEAALLVAAAKAGWEPEPLRFSYPRVGEVPFSSARKRMVTFHSAPQGAGLVCMKGAPEVVLAHCTSRLGIGGPVPLTAEDRRDILSANGAMARRALRVLAFAYRETATATFDTDDHTLEQGLSFAGLIGMVDPPRPEAGLALSQAKSAGVRTVMTTGDHTLTAVAVARELGLMRDGDRALTGAELDRLTDEQFDRIVEDVTLYARLSPEDKLRIVDALRRQQHVVAMTGDGINDAPALRRADIGIAMGITGTDVAREASDIVLADDNFATIVAAMEEGRIIYDNVKKYLAYLLSTNVGEILIMFVAGLAGLPLPLVAVHILWVNLVTDGLPAIALGVDPPDSGVMARPPRPPGESVFTPGVLLLIGVVGVLATLVVLPVFVLKLQQGAGVAGAQTMAFTMLVVFELCNAFNARSERRSLLVVGALRNRWLVLAVLCSITLQLAVVYSPWLQPVFRTVPLAPSDWLLIVPGGLLAIVGAEIGKWVMARRGPVSESSRP